MWTAVYVPKTLPYIYEGKKDSRQWFGETTAGNHESQRNFLYLSGRVPWCCTSGDHCQLTAAGNAQPLMGLTGRLLCISLYAMPVSLVGNH